MAEAAEQENHPDGETGGTAKETSAEERLWKVTATAEECAQRRAAIAARFNKIVSGLARCPVCGAKARAGTFGARDYGVWVGCTKSMRCSRNIVWHKEGWSLEEAAAVWNFYNGRPIVWLRKAKMWLEDMFGRYGREARKARKLAKAENLRIAEEMRRISGMREPKKKKNWKEKTIFWLNSLKNRWK